MMIKKTINTMLFCLLGGAAFAQSSIVCDFSAGIPSTWAQYDLDGCTPSKNSKEAGFEVGKGWILIEDSGNKVAASTSWYTPSGKANDWLVTEAVAVESDYQLRFSHRTTDDKYPDGFSVYVSTTGNTPEDFDPTESVLKVDACTKEWSSSVIPLNQYTGQQVWIAFVNDTYDHSRLYIDDVYVGPSYDANFKLDIPSITGVIPESFKGIMTNFSESDIQGFTINLTIGDDNFSQSFDALVGAGCSWEFTLSPELSLTPYQTPDYNVKLIVEGKTQFTLKGSVLYVPLRVVAEESTGAWCGWCVRGSVALDRLTGQYPDNFIGIAVHHGDILTDSNYDNSLSSAFSISGYPAAVFNRKTDTDPAELYNLVSGRLTTPSEAYVLVSAKYDSEMKTIEATADYTAVIDLNQPLSVAFVLTEDNVVMDNLVQTNYYSGSNEDMDGWENLGEYVPSSVKPFQHVARYISSFSGHSASKVENPTAGETYTFSYQFTMPKEVINPVHTKLTALLLNTSTKEIVNADQISLSDLIETGVSNIAVSSETDTKIYNINGIEVGPYHKGIVIINGKKMILR